MRRKKEITEEIRKKQKQRNRTKEIYTQQKVMTQGNFKIALKHLRAVKCITNGVGKPRQTTSTRNATFNS